MFKENPFKLIFYTLQLLNVNSTFLGQPLNNRRFVELLTASQFSYDTGLFELSFELLQRSFNVLAFFYRYYNHCFCF